MKYDSHSTIWENQRGHPLESSGQAGSCVFLIFLFKNQVFSSFKLILNMAKNLKRRVCWNCADRVEASEAGGYSGGVAGELIYEVVEK